MTRGKARIVVAAGAALLLFTLASPNRRAGIEIHAHRQGDRSPQQMQAVVDLGLVAFSFLLTWSRQLSR